MITYFANKATLGVRRYLGHSRWPLTVYDGLLMVGHL